MIIFSFDGAIENLGITICNFDIDWKDKLVKHISKLHELYDELSGITKETFIERSLIILRHMESILNNVLRIEWFNAIDLIYGKYVEEAPMLERTTMLKSMLAVLDKQFARPDLVLIEYQMIQNDISRILSCQIAYHYTSVVPVTIVEKLVDLRKQRKKQPDLCISNSVISYAAKEYPLNSYVNTSNTHVVPVVELIGPRLKNTYYLAPDGSYDIFIVKYSNYVANKKHCTHNFNYFTKVMGYPYTTCNKADDMADAFMMMFCYLKKMSLL